MITTTLLDPKHDPMGQAIADFHNGKDVLALNLFSSQFDPDTFPVEQLFRSQEEICQLEKIALQRAKGKILDVGGGAGCHSLALQAMGKQTLAIDISTLSVEVMKSRGVENATAANLFDEKFEGKFDTILMLMNGSGIVGSIDNLPTFFKRIESLLAPNGELLIDSSDLKYLFEDEDGSFEIDLMDDYYGQVDFTMEYDKIQGKQFDWLYIDPETLKFHAEQNGFSCEVIAKGEHYDYLASLRKK